MSEKEKRVRTSKNENARAAGWDTNESGKIRFERKSERRRLKWSRASEGFFDRGDRSSWRETGRAIGHRAIRRAGAAVATLSGRWCAVTQTPGKKNKKQTKKTKNKRGIPRRSFARSLHVLVPLGPPLKRICTVPHALRRYRKWCWVLS